MYNAANRKDIRKAEKQQLLDEKDRVAFVVAAMSHAEGRRWFYELLVRCHCFQEPFTGRALDEAYLKGERNIGLSVYGDIVNNCPDYFVMMMREATIREQINAERPSHEPADDSADESGDVYGIYESDESAATE